MKRLIALILILVPFFGLAQMDLTLFNHKFKEAPKVTFMFFTADWCGVCKIQDRQIVKDKLVQNFLSTDVYYLKLNGELKERIQFLDQSFDADPNYKNHSFLRSFIPDQDIVYPVWIILNENLEVIGKFSGLIRPKQFKSLIGQLNK